MKKTVLFLAVLCCALTTNAQQQPNVTFGNDRLERETRKVENFDKISVSGPFNVTLVQGDEAKVIVDAESNLQELITAQTENGKLTIAPVKGKLFKSSKGNKIAIKVYYTRLDEIAMMGSGNLKASKPLASDVKITLDGSGNAELKLQCKNAQAYVLGSGNIKLKGSAENFKCKILGSGEIRADELESQNVVAVISGAGNANVNSSLKIDGTITGSGNIAFTGEPAQRDLKRTGTGEFKVM